MNTILVRKGFSWLSGLAAVAVVGGGLSAHAQTVPTVDAASNAMSTESSSAELEAENQNFSFASETTLNSISENATALQQFPSYTTPEIASRTVVPIPGTVATSSNTLVSPESTQSATQVTNTRVAQADINIGGTTRGGSSYIGVAGNIGVGGGDSSLSDGNFAVISKIGLSNALSVRPSAILGDNTTIAIPVTYDFRFRQVDPFDEPLAIAPYVGVGAAIKTGDDSQAAFLVSGGVDVPLNRQFTATAAINAGFFDETDVGLLLGVGYNFSGF
ncbi:MULTISPECIES: hypothetical protein [unclassified Anabaena]|uniref:hypothetical protein n=1 Tax=unclassified Anabaena TaxID=2619674 RepID=UPI00082E8523|nr:MULTISPECIES: hypothetical protein [unclassified Anabaena]